MNIHEIGPELDLDSLIVKTNNGEPLSEEELCLVRAIFQDAVRNNFQQILRKIQTIFSNLNLNKFEHAYPTVAPLVSRES